MSTYISKHNSNRENQTILLHIPKKGEWHDLVVKKLSALLRVKNDGNFYCLNYLHSI